MIKIQVLKENHKISHIKISGHSGYSTSGSDIVCAAISSIVVTTVNGILSIGKTIEANDDGDTLEIQVLSHDEVTDKLLLNMIQLFEGIETQYKKNVKVYVKGE